MKKTHAIACFVIILMFQILGCIEIDTIDQPETINVNSDLHMTMNVKFQPDDRDSVRVVVALLTPKDWEVGHRSTLTYTSDRGNGDLEPMPSTEFALGTAVTWPIEITNKIGIGNNFDKDLIWTVFRTTKRFKVSKQDPEIKASVKITLKSGPKNCKFNMGYFIGNDQQGCLVNAFSMRYLPLDVVGGLTENTDYTSRALSTSFPGIPGDDDIITLVVDRNAVHNQQVSNKLFLKAVAVTNNNRTYTVEEESLKTQLQPIGLDKARIQFMPKTYFSISGGEHLRKITYYYGDSENRKILQNNKQPFTINFCK